MKNIIFLVLTVTALISCEEIMFDKDYTSTNPLDNFEYLWNECDRKYSYFELKNVDWNKVHEKYAAQLYEDMTEDSLFKVMRNMLLELKDGHVNLISDFNVSYFNIYGLGQDNFEPRVITDYYLPPNYYNTGPFSHEFIADKQVGYIRFSEFSGLVDDENLDFIIERYKDTKGLIIDIRENGGGDPMDFFNILGRFIEEKTLMYYSRLKNGAEHDNFTNDVPGYLKPYNGIRYTNKVIILTDRGTYSAGSFTSLATKALPNVILVGDTTGGGLGLPNGGQLPNGWNYRFSITQTLTLDKNNSYEKGVPPDIVALFDWTDLTTDEVIERALDEILER
ncbi:MAG: S41 family peptidase [Salinivirgaceae bacterium]|jgi:hypothetical protein|nr:S41 family peptidase [Salinivirgaceae bacterium]